MASSYCRRISVAQRLLVVLTVVLCLWATKTRAQDECGNCQPCCQPAAAPPAPPPVDYGGCFWCRPKLTGDWCGWRNDLANCDGITLDADETLFFGGIASGGLGQSFNVAGHGDYVINIDGSKLFDREGLFIKLRAEHRYGTNADADAGVFLSPEIVTDLPFNNSDEVALTDVLITQALSKNFAVFAGKLDTFDGDHNEYASGRGKTQFSNVGFVVNPCMLRSVPYSTLGAGFIVLKDLQPVFTLTVMNPTNTIGTSGFEDLFGDGVLLNGELHLKSNFGCLPGHQLAGFVWSSKNFVSLGQDPRILLPDVPIDRAADTWACYFNFDQALYVDPATKKNWGLFGRLGFADKTVSPIESFLSFGIGGSTLNNCRPDDTFGIGWYEGFTSDQIGPLLTTALGPIGDGQAVEMYYNYEYTKWCHITPDLQVLMPARENVDTSLFLGVRVKIDL